MIARSLKLFSSGIVCIAAVASITIASCENNSTNPGEPTGKTGRQNGKGPQTLSNDCITTVQIDRCATGGAQLVRSESDPSVILAYGLSEAGGITSSFEPGSYWTQNLQVAFPASGGGSLTYSALGEGAVQSTLGIAQSAADPNALSFSPTFTGGDGEEVFYDLEVWNNNDLVARRIRIPFTVTTTVYNSECCNLLSQLAFYIDRQTGGCSWRSTAVSQVYAAMPACCSVTITLNGEIFNGNQVRFIERNDSGNYPYHESDQIGVTGNVSSYAIRSEAAGS